MSTYAASSAIASLLPNWFTSDDAWFVDGDELVVAEVGSTREDVLPLSSLATSHTDLPRAVKKTAAAWAERTMRLRTGDLLFSVLQHYLQPVVLQTAHGEVYLSHVIDLAPKP